MLWQCTKEASFREIQGIDFAQPFTLSMILTPPAGELRGPTVIAQGAVDYSGTLRYPLGHEAWDLRVLPSGRLGLGVLTDGRRETRETRYGYRGGSFRADVTWNDGVLTLAALSAGAPLTDTETIQLMRTGGSPLSHVYLGAGAFTPVHQPFGWRCDCSVLRGSYVGSGAFTPAPELAEPLAEGPRDAVEAFAGQQTKAVLSADLHWQALLLLAGSGMGHIGEDSAESYAAQAGRLVKAHEAWKEGAK